MASISKLFSLVFAIALSGGNAFAADYPERAVNITVPFAAGGGSDLFVRQLAQLLSKNWGQPVIVENRPGASSQIGTSHVARAKADGYNLLYISNPFTLNPGLFKSLPYDTERDFEPITLMVTGPFILLANPSLRVNTVNELIALAKAKPGTINFGSSGMGGPDHMAMEVLAYRTGIDMVHVPFSGTGKALPSLLGGETQLEFVGGISASPYLHSDKLTVLAVSTAERLKALPEIPTIAEAAGIDGFNVVAEYGMVAPTGTSKEIIDKIQAEIAKILQSGEMQQTIAKMGAVMVASTPEEFREYIHNEIKAYDEVIKAVGIKVEQ